MPRLAPILPRFVRNSLLLTWSEVLVARLLSGLFLCCEKLSTASFGQLRSSVSGTWVLVRGPWPTHPLRRQRGSLVTIIGVFATSTSIRATYAGPRVYTTHHPRLWRLFSLQMRLWSGRLCTSAHPHCLCCPPSHLASSIMFSI